MVSDSHTHCGSPLLLKSRSVRKLESPLFMRHPGGSSAAVHPAARRSSPPVVSENSNRPYSCGIPVVIAEQSTQPLVAAHLPFSRIFKVRFDELILQPLVVPLPVVVLAELVDRPSQ